MILGLLCARLKKDRSNGNIEGKWRPLIFFNDLIGFSWDVTVSDEDDGLVSLSDEDDGLVSLSLKLGGGWGEEELKGEVKFL